MKIRLIQHKDIPQFINLLAQLGYPQENRQVLKTKIKEYNSQQSKIYVSELNGKINGFISVFIFPFVHEEGLIGRITALCVDEQNRQSGIGKALMKKAEEFCINNNCKRIEVTSGNRKERQISHNFYERLGYKESRKRFIKGVG